MKNSQGGCICGSVRYQIVAEPITLFACHCSDCQTVTGSGFVLALRVPYGGVTVLKGEARPYERTEADERRRIIHRCPYCLTVLWTERPDSKVYITIYGGTLDDSPTLRPVAHIWTQDAQPWMTLPKGAPLYDQNPPDMQPIIEAWRRQNQNAPNQSPEPLRKEMKVKIIKYLAYFLMVALAIMFVRAVFLEIKVHQRAAQIDEEIKKDGIDGTNQISN